MSAAGAMALERCHVETWAEFGSIGTSCSPKLIVGSKTDVFLCTGCDEIYVFSTKQRKLTASIAYSLQSDGDSSAKSVLFLYSLFAGCPPVS